MQVQVLLPAPYRVFITNLRVGNGYSIFCRFVLLYVWAGAFPLAVPEKACGRLPALFLAFSDRCANPAPLFRPPGALGGVACSFVMQVKRLEYTLPQHLFGFPHGNCACLRHSAAPNTPRICSVFVSAALGSSLCLRPHTHQFGHSLTLRICFTSRENSFSACRSMSAR